MAITGLHVLIDPGRVPEDRLAAFLAAIRRGGASAVQVRIKEGSSRAALQYIREVRRSVGNNLTLIINDRVDWALAGAADGVHLGQDDLPLDVARKLGPHLILGASAGNAEELDRVLSHRPDYIGIGPVFQTPSKEDAGAPLGAEGLRSLIARLPDHMTAIAIGGIEPGNVDAVWVAGAGGVAVIHAVTGAPDPEVASRALLRFAPHHA